MMRGRTWAARVAVAGNDAGVTTVVPREHHRISTLIFQRHTTYERRGSFPPWPPAFLCIRDYPAKHHVRLSLCLSIIRGGSAARHWLACEQSLARRFDHSVS